MSKLNNNVYGVIGIEAINSNWNADFDGYPKTDGNGNYKGSPYALQYTMKKLWDNKGEIVLGIKTNNEKGNVSTLEDRYKSLFNKDKDIKRNLLKCKDVKNFGVCCTIKPNVVTMQGVVQIADGINKYKESIVNTETILSPYASGSGKSMATNGSRVTIGEAHYLYPFTISPNELKDEEYGVEDYEDFKSISLKSVSLYNSKTKVGCNNEFALFVKVKEENNYLISLGDLSRYIEIEKEDNTVIYNLTNLEKLLSEITDKIDNVEIYYRNKLNKIVGFEDNNLNVKQFNIITRKEIK